MRCSRLGCDGHAVATFCFDARAALVWLDVIDPRYGLGAGVLCERHADLLTPPRGWHLQDRRTGAPRLWDERPLAAPVQRTSSARGPVRSHDAPGPPLPFEPAPVPAAPAPVQPELTELARLLDARTPLLTRAFAAVRDA